MNGSPHKKHFLWKEMFLYLIPPLLVATFPCIFMYAQNVEEASFKEILQPLNLFLLIALVSYLCISIFLRSWQTGGIVSCAFLLCFLNFTFILNFTRRLMPVLRYWHVTGILLFILFHFAFFMKGKLGDIKKDILILTTFLFGGLILFNLVIAAPHIIKKAQLNNQNFHTGASFSMNTSQEQMPNVFWLLFDEYSSLEVAKNIYGYDNTPFANKLEDMGFNVSYSGRNDSVNTTTVVSNMTNFDYIVTDKTPVSEYEYLRRNGKIFSTFRSFGYEVNLVGETSFFTPESDEKDLAAKTISGQTIAQLLYDQTPMKPFVVPSSETRVRAVKDTIAWFDNKNDLSPENTFTLCYLRLPHEPFFFDENGNEVPFHQRTNWKDKSYYLGQYKYATKVMENMVSSIIEADPSAIIILQSDHSARAAGDQDLFNKLIPFDQMITFFNAVYYQGEQVNIEGLSGVNTLRTVLNKLFSMELPMLEVPVNEI